jgi:Tfp pilus assembly protein PilP
VYVIGLYNANIVLSDVRAEAKEISDDLKRTPELNSFVSDVRAEAEERVDNLYVTSKYDRP